MKNRVFLSKPVLELVKEQGAERRGAVGLWGGWRTLSRWLWEDTTKLRENNIGHWHDTRAEQDSTDDNHL